MRAGSEGPVRSRRREAAGGIALAVSAGLLVSALLASVGVGSGPVVSALPGCDAGTTINFVAHADDDLLFQSPALLNDIRDGLCIRTVYVLAGDAGDVTEYWESREAGVQAAYAQMVDVENEWTTSDAGVAQHPIEVDTLNGMPNVSLAFMRLPDGNIDGTGFPSTDNESLQKLYGAVINAVSAVDGSSDYSLEELVSTFLELMDSYQADSVNTMDYEGTYGDGDHSDHHSLAYLVLAAEQRYATAHGFAGYQGYGIAGNPENVFEPDRAAKTEAFLTYGAYDYKTCSTAAACASRPEGAWFSRMYTVGEPVPRPTPTPSPSPPPAPGGNVAGSATVGASSQNTSTGQTAVKAVDGVVDGYPGDFTREWATVRGGVGSFLSLAWSGAQTLGRVVLYDRPNADDRVTGGTLTFSDGSSVAVPALDNAGGATTVTFSARATTSLRFTVTSVSGSTSNIGLAEVQAFAGGTTPQAGSSGSEPAVRGAVALTALTQPRAALPPFIPPGATPEEARNTIGLSPEVTVGVLRAVTAAPSVLGTTLIWNSAESTLRVQPLSVGTVGEGAAGDTRLVSVDVDFTAAAGNAAYAYSDFALKDSDGTLYPATSPAAAGAFEPLGSGVLSAGQEIQGRILFEVPLDSPSLLIAYLAQGAELGTWTLTAP